jgi:hypothetical protein
MSRHTHVVESNGFSRGPLIDSVRPYREAIEFSLGRMNGSSFWAYSLWRAPEGAGLLDDIPVSDEYVQSAGASDALTVEVRVVGDDGVARQFVVGKPGGVAKGSPSEVVTWDDGRHCTYLYPHELFTAKEAAEVFYAYFVHDSVPAEYRLRELNVNA